jgi:hypothetical protein
MNIRILIPLMLAACTDITGDAPEQPNFSTTEQGVNVFADDLGVSGDVSFQPSGTVTSGIPNPADTPSFHFRGDSTGGIHHYFEPSAWDQDSFTMLIRGAMQFSYNEDPGLAVQETGGLQIFLSTDVDTTNASGQALSFLVSSEPNKVAGSGTVNNYAIVSDASGGDANWSWYSMAGFMEQAGGAHFGQLTSADELKAGLNNEFWVEDTGEVHLGQEVDSFRILPNSGEATMSVGTSYTTGAQITTKNKDSGSTTAGIALALDTAINSGVRGGLEISRGSGGFSGAYAGMVISSGAGYVASSTANDAVIYSSQKILMTADGTNWLTGAQLDGTGTFQAKALKAGATMGTGSQWTSGTGSPAGVVTGNVGDMYTRTDGGAGTTLYVKESSNGTTSGWAAK